MKYALLIYNTTAEDSPEDAAPRPSEAGFAAVLDRPDVVGWVALNLADPARDPSSPSNSPPHEDVFRDQSRWVLSTPVGSLGTIEPAKNAA